MEVLVIIIIISAIINSISKSAVKQTKSKNVKKYTESLTPEQRARLERKLQKPLEAVWEAASVIQGQTTTSPVKASQTKWQEANTVQSNIKSTPVKNKENVPEIVKKAKGNNEKLMKDQTLLELEKAHGHSEKHQKTKVEHSAVCHTINKDDNAIIASESVLGSVEDLIVKGYSGDINFGRDFISEGLDMIAGFTVPDTVNFEKR